MALDRPFTRTVSSMYRPEVVVRVWTQDEIDLIVKEFHAVDRVAFDGKLNDFNISLQFAPTALSKHGSYHYSERKIILNCNNTIQERIHTLWHEMVHAYGHYCRVRHAHDQWFWFTLGQVAAMRGQKITSTFCHTCPDDILSEHK